MKVAREAINLTDTNLLFCYVNSIHFKTFTMHITSNTFYECAMNTQPNDFALFSFTESGSISI